MADEVGTAELFRRATGDIRELGRLEIALAKDELLQDLSGIKVTAALASAAVVAALTGISAVIVALVITLGPLVVCVLGVLLLVASAVLGFAAYRALPKPLMPATARRLRLDAKILEEHLS